MRKIKIKNKEDKLLEKFLKLIVKLPHEQYFGIVRILNVDFTETMKKEEIEEEIKTIEEQLVKLEENSEEQLDKIDSAPDAMKNGDNAEEEEKTSTEIEENFTVAAENSSRIEGMRNRLEKLKEEKEKDEDDIEIQKFRTGEAIMLDTIAKFTQLSNTKKKNLLAILKAGAY